MKTKYIETAKNSSKITHIRVELAFKQGGFNSATKQQEEKGYYMYINPVQRETIHGVDYDTFVFKGEQMLLLAAQKQTVPRCKMVVQKANTLLRSIIPDICKRNRLVTTEEVKI